eukprot:3011583-Pyramimonas_sp.AAC.1
MSGFSPNKQVRELADKEVDGGPFSVLQKDITRFLTTILIGSTVSGIGATALITDAAFKVRVIQACRDSDARKSITSRFRNLPVAHRLTPSLCIWWTIFSCLAKSESAMQP